MSEEKRRIEDEMVPAEPTARAGELVGAMFELELPFRATLELSYRRGLDDSAIAEVAGLDERGIGRQRERALDWLAQRTEREGAEGIAEVEADLRAFTSEQWSGEAGPAQEAAPAPGGEPDPAEDADLELTAASEDDRARRGSIPPPGASPREPVTRPFPSSPTSSEEPRARRFGRPMLLILVAVLLIVLAVILLSSGADGDGSDRAAGNGTEASNSTTGAGGGREGNRGGGGGGGGGSGGKKLQALPGAEAQGTIEASLSGPAAGPTLKLRLRGYPKPDGKYVAWLYKSVIDSKALGGTGKGSGTIEAELPDGWQDYPFVDVSIQARGTDVHSGRSVARIATDDLSSR